MLCFKAEYLSLEINLQRICSISQGRVSVRMLSIIVTKGSAK